MAKMKSIRILILDDDEIIRTGLSISLEKLSYTVFAESNSMKGLDIILNDKVDAALIDFFMPEADGLAILDSIKKSKPYFPAIMLTGFGSTTLAVEWMKKGGADFIEKPVDSHEILDLKIRLALSLSHERYLRYKLNSYEKSGDFVSSSLKILNENYMNFINTMESFRNTEKWDKISNLENDINQIGKVIHKMTGLI